MWSLEPSHSAPRSRSHLCRKCNTMNPINIGGNFCGAADPPRWLHAIAAVPLVKLGGLRASHRNLVPERKPGHVHVPSQAKDLPNIASYARAKHLQHRADDLTQTV